MAMIDMNGVELDNRADGITVVKCYFGRKKKKCVRGFGICKCKPLSNVLEVLGGESGGALERAIARPHKDFFAAFILDEKNSSMEIRFLEPIPHFEADFYVDEGYPGAERLLRNLCGYEQLLPTIGRYTARRKRGAPHGAVVVPVLRGKKMAKR